MKWPTTQLTYVDVTAHESALLTNGYESNLTTVYRAAAVYEQIEEYLSWLVGRDQWMLSLFAWQDNVNAEVGKAWQMSSFCRILFAGPSCLTEPSAFRTFDPQGRTEF